MVPIIRFGTGTEDTVPLQRNAVVGCSPKIVCHSIVKKKGFFGARMPANPLASPASDN